MPDDITLDELSVRTGETAETLRGWRDLGLFTTRGDAFLEQDILRAGVVRIVLRRGIELDVIAQLQREYPFLDREVERCFPRGVRQRYTIDEAVERAETDRELLERFARAGNLFDDDGLLDELDVRSLRTFCGMVGGGFPEEVLLQTFRVFADATDKAAQASLHAYHMYVHERHLASGLAPDVAHDASRALSQRSSASAEPALIYFFRKAQMRAVHDDVALHVLEDSGLLTIPREPGEVTRAIMFVDLSSYTPMVAAMGDSAAAEVLARFSSIVRQVARQQLGHVVKQIGDAFMLAFPDPRSAISTAMEIEAMTSEEPQFPAARSGIHFGPLVYRDGDYVGAVANIASRLTSEAERHEILATSDVRDLAKSVPQTEFVSLGKRTLKGLTGEIELFDVRREAAPTSVERTVDPVCGMELSEAEAVARLALGGTEQTFCSDTCLRLFVATPARYR